MFYKTISNVYDLLDVIYFRNYKKSPRKVVFDSINGNDKILDLCTYFERYGLKIEQFEHCDYTKVIILKKESHNQYIQLLLRL